MSSTCLIKRGENTPNNTQLREYELGFSTTTKKLYINDNGDIRELSSISLKTTIRLTRTTTDVTILNLKLTNDCSVFIDLDFSVTSLNDVQIKAFRKADLVYSTHTDTSLTLKINGKKPTRTITIPIQITVVY